MVGLLGGGGGAKGMLALPLKLWGGWPPSPYAYAMYEYAAVCLYFTSTILRGGGRAEGAIL